MKRAGVVMFVVAAAVTHADAEPEAPASREAVVKLAIDALAKRDTAAFSKVATFPLDVRNLWFDTPACRKFAGHSVTVEQADAAALVECLGSGGVHELAGWLPAAYGPGVPFAPIVRDGHVTLLVGVVAFDDSTPTVDPATFATHVAKFTRNIAPDDAERKRLDGADGESVQASLTVCVDAKGKVERVLADAPLAPGYATRVENIARAWRVTPFLVHHAAIPVCTRMIVGYPEARLVRPLEIPLPPPPPPPPPPSTDAPAPPSAGDGTRPLTVTPTLLEGQRIAGRKLIVPDDMTKVEITKSKRDRIIGSFKLCLDAAGTVADVRMLKSTGFAAYDAKIVREMQAWRYRPYEMDGKAVPVCTAVTFIYSQH